LRRTTTALAQETVNEYGLHCANEWGAKRPSIARRLFDANDKELTGNVRLLPDSPRSKRVVTQPELGIYRKGQGPWVDNPSAHRSRDEGNPAAAATLVSDVTTLFATADGAEGIQSFAERRKANFTGH
jgi:hypothetical protein